MRKRYYEYVCDNLNRLRTVAVFHPRLAYVGVSSELEILVREMNPKGLKIWTDDQRSIQESRYPRRDYDTDDDKERLVSSVVRYRLRRWGDIETAKWLSQDVRSCLHQMFGGGGKRDRSGQGRHSRHKVSYEDAEGAVRLAVQLVHSLRPIRYSKRRRRTLAFTASSRCTVVCSTPTTTNPVRRVSSYFLTDSGKPRSVVGPTSSARRST